MERFSRYDRGSTLGEYSILLALLVAISVVVVQSFGSSITAIFTNEVVTAEVAVGGVNGQCNAQNPDYPNC